MKIYKRIALVTFYFLLLANNTVFAASRLPVEFFASNNTQEIDIQHAYDRLTGKEQHQLQNAMITVMQKNHLEQGRFADVLGAYRMSSDQNITADNTEKFNTSPYQYLTEEKIFSMATEMAISLKQDSVAVFIPDDQSSVGDVVVSFKGVQPDITSAVAMIHDRLPVNYSQAYSLRLNNEYAGINNATVAQIEWLGSKINIDEIKSAFPGRTISYRYGKVYLVYQNGNKEQI